MGNLYVDVANKVIELLPADWNKFVFYTRADGDDYYMNFFYYPEGSEECVECRNIENMDTGKMDGIFEQAWKIMKEERDIIAGMNNELWTMLTIVFGADGRFRAKYDFTPVDKMDEKFMEQWRDNYLLP